MPKPNTGVSANSGPVVRPPRPFVAGGDLTGTPTLQTVTGIQGFPVNPQTPNFDNVLKWTGTEYLPQAEAGGGGGPAVDVGALHPASAMRVAGGTLVNNNQQGGGGDLHPGSVLTTQGGIAVRGSVFDAIEQPGLWVLGDGVLIQANTPTDGISTVIPLFDDDSTAVAVGRNPLAFGGSRAWALCQVPNIFPLRGSLSIVNPFIGQFDYSNDQASQAVVEARIDYSLFPGIDSNAQVFYDDNVGQAVVYCPSGFLDKQGGVFYAVVSGAPGVYTVVPYTVSNSDTVFGSFQLVSYDAFNFCENDGFLYALVTVFQSGPGFQKRIVRIDTSTNTITGVCDLGNINWAFYLKLEYSQFLDMFFFVNDAGTLYQIPRDPFPSNAGNTLDLSFPFTVDGGSFFGLISVATNGQSRGVAVGNTSYGLTRIVDIELSGEMSTGAVLDVNAELGVSSNGPPQVDHVLFVGQFENSWWLFDNSNGTAYRYFGNGNPTPYPRYTYGVQAAWEQPPVVFDRFVDKRNIRANWPGYSPADYTRTGILNLSVAGGEPTGAVADYAMIIGGHDHSNYGVACSIIGGSGNSIFSGTNAIILGGTDIQSNFGTNAIAGGRFSSAQGDNSLSIGLQTNSGGASAQAFGGNLYAGSDAGADYSLVHGAGGGSNTDAEYVHGACDQNLGLVWQYGRFMFRGHSVNGSTTTLTSPQPGAAQEFATIGNKRSQYVFRIHIMATRIFSDAAFGSATWIRTVTGHVNEAVTAFVIDSTLSEVTQLNGVAWTISITAVGLTLHMTLTGTAGHTIRVTGWMEYGWCLAFPNS